MPSRRSVIATLAVVAVAFGFGSYAEQLRDRLDGGAYGEPPYGEGGYGGPAAEGGYGGSGAEDSPGRERTSG